jgi:hypothetical protein
MPREYPKFSAVCRREDWLIEAKWPDDTIDVVANSFKSQDEAFEWLNHVSELWIDERQS